MNCQTVLLCFTFCIVLSKKSVLVVFSFNMQARHLDYLKHLPVEIAFVCFLGIQEKLNRN